MVGVKCGSRDLGGDFSVSRGVELDDEQQRRGREALEEDGEQSQRTSNVEVFPVAPLALCRRSTSSTNRGVDKGESNVKFSLIASHFRRLTKCRLRPTTMKSRSAECESALLFFYRVVDLSPRLYILLYEFQINP